MAAQCVKIVRKTSSAKVPHSVWSTVKSIKDKVEQHSLCLSKADKGNTVVVMERQHYIREMEKFLEDNNVGTINLTLTSFGEDIRKCIRESEYIIEPRAKPDLPTMNPAPPVFMVFLRFIKTAFPSDPLFRMFPPPRTGCASIWTFGLNVT